MKILFCADIHIKLGQKGVPVEWALNRYKLLIADIAELQKSCDMVIIGGDVFDKMPNMEELAVYYDLVSAITKSCIIYPGNHEATKKGHTFFTHLASVTNKINSLVRVVDDFETYILPDANLTRLFNIIPYNKLKDFEKDPHLIKEQAKILFTHVRGEIPPHVKPEIDLDLFNKWELVVAGDLHSHENSQRNIVYPGSPVTTSFHRGTVITGVIIVDTETVSYEFVSLELPQLIRKTVQAGEETPATSYHHTVYEVEGDMSTLSSLEDSDLVERKVAKRTNDVALMLDPDMSIEQEVSEYLKYILALDDNTVTDVLQELSNHAEKINWH